MKATLILLALPLLAIAQNAQPNLQWVDEEVTAIKPPRKGLQHSELRVLKNPFAAQLLLNQPPVEGNQTVALSSMPEEQNDLALQAIINGHTALIDGKWYQQDERSMDI